MEVVVLDIVGKQSRGRLCRQRPAKDQQDGNYRPSRTEGKPALAGTNTEERKTGDFPECRHHRKHSKRQKHQKGLIQRPRRLREKRKQFEFRSDEDPKRFGMRRCRVRSGSAWTVRAVRTVQIKIPMQKNGRKGRLQVRSAIAFHSRIVQHHGLIRIRR